MRVYVGIDPGTESMGVAIYDPSSLTIETKRLSRKNILESYTDGAESTFNIINGYYKATKELIESIQDRYEVQNMWIERTFSIHSPIFSPTLVVLTTILKEELKMKAVSVKHWRKVLTEKGNIPKKECIELLKKTFVELADKSNDEVEAVGIAIACAIENNEINPLKPFSNREIRKINRKSKTKNGKKHTSTKSSDRSVPSELIDKLNDTTSS